MRQVLGTTRADFHDFADRLAAVSTGGAVAVVGSKQAFAAANEARHADGATPFEVRNAL